MLAVLTEAVGCCSPLVREPLSSEQAVELARLFKAMGDPRFIAKVQHSAFYSTPLDYLLGRLRVDRVILTGQVTEQCILYSALDAYVRHFEVRIPPDAVAPLIPDLGEAALRMMEANMRAELVDSARCLD